MADCQPNRDREGPRSPSPPTPPGIRITYQGGSADSVKNDGVDISGEPRAGRSSRQEGQKRERGFGLIATARAQT